MLATMGHYKTLHDGLHWWSEHMRGNRDLGFFDEDYEVVKDDDEE